MPSKLAGTDIVKLIPPDQILYRALLALSGFAIPEDANALISLYCCTFSIRTVSWAPTIRRDVAEPSQIQQQ
jgi:hypothetical protein